MSYTCHHTIIVTSFSKEHTDAAHHHALEIFDGHVTSVVQSPMNLFWTFLVAPDGSSEGWVVSDEGDARRNTFIDWLNSQRYEDGSSPFKWCEVQYGDEEDDNRIIRDEANMRPEYHEKED